MKPATLFEKASGKPAYPKTEMDRKEYLASGYYVESLRQSIAGNGEIEDAEFTEVDSVDKRENSAEDNQKLAETFKQVSDENKSLEDMTKEELRAKYEEVLGKKPAAAKGEASLIKDIKAAE